MGQIKFKVKVSDLLEALDFASVVQPMSRTSHGGRGFLLVVGTDQCAIHSRDIRRFIRTSMPIMDVEVDGDDRSFVYPSDHISGFKYLPADEVIQVEATHGDDNSHSVKYTTIGGKKKVVVDRPSLDPRIIMSAHDKALENSQATERRTVPVAILSEALSVAKPMLPSDPSRVQAMHQMIQTFDPSKPEWERGDGTLYAADGVQQAYFKSEAFMGVPLAIHMSDLSVVQGFLSKCKSRVDISMSNGLWFLTDTEKDRVFSWTDTPDRYGKFQYYAKRSDTHSFIVPVKDIVDSLSYTLAEMEKDKDALRMIYDASSDTLIFQSAEGTSKAVGFPVKVERETYESSEPNCFEPFSIKCKGRQILNLFTGGFNQVNFRVKKFPEGSRVLAYFRTVNDFFMSADGKVSDKQTEGSSQCQVTRFAPSL